jgi:hypothetical protein
MRSCTFGALKDPIQISSAALVGLVLALVAAPLPAAGAVQPTRKKAIWGPVKRDGRSQFPIYRDLGAGIYEMTLSWRNTAPRRPARQQDPGDAAYDWPADVGYAVRQARKYGMQVSLMVMDTPGWANGGRDRRWVPKRVRTFRNFVIAASRRYPAVKHWMIWGEPSRKQNFQPLPKFEARGPRAYARLLDAGYAGLKSVSRRNKVIGGNTFTTGDVPPLQFIRQMKLPNGRRPRMDMYGHNPFTRRKPDLSKPPIGFGYADFSDLDTLAGWLDRYQGRRHGRPLKLFLSEWFMPTDHANHEFNFYVTRETQADWLTAALRITRRWSRIYTLGWFSLYDDPHHGSGPDDAVHRGLLDPQGRKKPSYRAYKRG